MRLPWDVRGEEFIRRLARPGYRATRQTGSHVRLTRRAEKDHHITIPRHGYLKVGTLNSILQDVAAHLKVTTENLMRQLWEGD